MIRSPFFYVGDKYKLVGQLLKYIPDGIKTYVEPFYGGGSSQLQVEAERYFLNDVDPFVIRLHRFLLREMNDKERFFSTLFSMIDRYGLSCSFQRDVVPTELKKEYPKTYYSRYNKEAYTHLREDFNRGGQSDDYMLYLLLIYGFNHMIRFNSKREFNLPVGNVDFNKNVYNALNSYHEKQKNRNIVFSTADYLDFLESLTLGEEDYVYCDPPYLISMSEYNKLWNEEREKELYECLDSLDKRGIRFGITNLISHKGRINSIFQEWAESYLIEKISSNYISFNDNTIKNDSMEVYVHN